MDTWSGAEEAFSDLCDVYLCTFATRQCFQKSRDTISRQIILRQKVAETRTYVNDENRWGAFVGSAADIDVNVQT